MENWILVLAIATTLSFGLAWGAQQGAQPQQPQQTEQPQRSLPGQQLQGGAMDPAEVASRMKEKLGLSDQQTQKVQQVIENFRNQMQALRAKGSSQGSNESMRADRMKIMDNRDAQLKAILTPDQWRQYEQMRSRQRQGQAQRRQQLQGLQARGQTGLRQPGLEQSQSGQRPPQRMDPARFATRIKERIGLSDQQTSQVRSVMEDFQNRMEQLNQQNGGAAHARSQSMRDQRRNLVEERDAKIKSILTPDQWTQFQQMMAEMRQRRQNRAQPPRPAQNPQ